MFRRLFVALFAVALGFALMGAPAASAAPAPASVSAQATPATAAAQSPVDTVATVVNKGKAQSISIKATCAGAKPRVMPQATTRGGVAGVSLSYGGAGNNQITLKSVRITVHGKRARDLTSGELKQLLTTGRVHAVFLPNQWPATKKGAPVDRLVAKFADSAICKQAAPTKASYAPAA